MLTRLLLVLLLGAAGSACGGDSDDDAAAERCEEARRAITLLEPEAQAAMDAVDAAKQRGGSYAPEQDRLNTAMRRVSQIMVSEPGCFSVREVAGAREWLDRTR